MTAEAAEVARPEGPAPGTGDVVAGIHHKSQRRIEVDVRTEEQVAHEVVGLVHPPRVLADLRRANADVVALRPILRTVLADERCH